MSAQSILRESAHRRTIESNLFPAALPAIEWNKFSWHSGKGSASHTFKEHSSQALTIDVFGTLKASESRDAALGELARNLGLPDEGPWQVELEWQDPDNLVGERQQSRIDAVAISPRALIFFECKFTEIDGGTCSQTRPILRGKHKGLVQCNGSYMPQVNPTNGKTSACALTPKKMRYWELVPEVFNIPAELGYRPCPFAGPWFQWMRNLTICWAVAQARGLQPAFVLAYADGPTLPMAARIQSADWARFTKVLKPNTVPVRTLPIQSIVSMAQTANPNDPTWPELQQWVTRKIESVCRARQIYAADSAP